MVGSNANHNLMFRRAYLSLPLPRTVSILDDDNIAMNSSAAVAEAVAVAGGSLSSSLLCESIGIAIVTTPKGSHES